MLSGFLSVPPQADSIAYQTNRTGNGDIYVIGADGHNKVQLTRSPDIDLVPSWELNSGNGRMRQGSGMSLEPDALTWA